MIGTVPLAFIGAHVRHTLVIHAHTHREGGEEGRLCHKKCPCQGKLLVPSVDRILTLLLLVRVTVTVTVGAGAGAGAAACLLLVCLTDLLLFILISGSNTPTLKEHGLCTAQSSRCFRFLHWLCCPSPCRRSLGMPTSPPSACPATFCFFLCEATWVCLHACVCASVAD